MPSFCGLWIPAVVGMTVGFISHCTPVLDTGAAIPLRTTPKNPVHPVHPGKNPPVPHPPLILSLSKDHPEPLEGPPWPTRRRLEPAPHLMRGYGPSLRLTPTPLRPRKSPPYHQPCQVKTRQSTPTTPSPEVSGRRPPVSIKIANRHDAGLPQSIASSAQSHLPQRTPLRCVLRPGLTAVRRARKQGLNLA